MSSPPLVHVTARDGRTVQLGGPDDLPDDLGGPEVVVGRDERCTLAFPDEARLSRRALSVRRYAAGVLLTCESRTHGLVVDVDGAVSRLAPAADGGPSGGYVLGRGRATVAGPSWGASPFAVTVTVTGTPAASSGPVALTGTATAEPMRLRTHTKEFVTALLLCRHRLLDPTDAAPPPTVPELTRAVLSATNSWHLVRAMDADEAVRARLTGRIHEHLKALRVKLVRGGLAVRGDRLTPAQMVDLLVGGGVITRGHLALLDDDVWLRHQESAWWDA